MKEHVILVDEKDQRVGEMEKLQAHREGQLHRAISVLIFNKHGELLLQKRADHKYHSGGLWTNTCCSHPRPGESTQAAAKRRLLEEMGISLNLQFAYKFQYKANVDGLIENELDHVFLGETDQQPVINQNEASDWKYASIDAIKKDINHNAQNYTAWFKIIMQNIDSFINRQTQL
ncbi:MAG: isopentenyl-diphosphate Delta-isomerase [Fulvivirga sp.]|nr:isopentenyl-diphosphate Delta-isomerase [Fulvivirga sp.]